MWDELTATTLAAWAVGAILVGSGLGFLPRSRWRFVLISILTAAPVLLVMWAVVMTAVDKGSLDLPMSFGFTAVFTMLLLPPWALLTLLPFNLVRRYREIRADGDSGDCHRKCGGITVSRGTFINTATGTTGSFYSLGGGGGADIGVAESIGTASSLALLNGGGASFNASAGIATFSANGSLGHHSLTPAGKSAGIGLGPSKWGVSATMTGTKVYGCKVRGQ